MNMRRYRKPPRNEAQLEVRTRDLAADNGWKRKKMSSPASRGTLDDYFLKGGRHVWIELKMPGNTPSELQWAEINNLREHGGEAYWANTLEQVAFILACDGPAWAHPRYLHELPPQEEWEL